MKLTNKTTTNQRQVVHKIWNGTMVNLEKGKEMKEFQGDFQSKLMCLRVFPYLFLLLVPITLNHFLSCILTQLVTIIYLFLMCSAESRSQNMQANQFEIRIKEYHLKRGRYAVGFGALMLYMDIIFYIS